MGRGCDWLPIVQYLQENYFCIMPDLPGHGENLSIPIEQALSYPSLATGLLTLMEKIGLQRVSLIGYSMGGRIALYFAIHYAEKVQRLVLESAHPGLIDEQARNQRTQIDEQRANQILLHGIETFVDSWYQMDFFRSMHQQPDAFAVMKMARKKNSPQWMAKVIRELSPGVQPALWNHLTDFAIKTLLIAGAGDTKYVHTLRKASEMIPHASLKIIPDAGHNTHFEAPKVFCAQVRNFLAEQTLKNSGLP